MVLFVTPESFPRSPWHRLAAIMAAAALWPVTVIVGVAWCLWSILNVEAPDADR